MVIFVHFIASDTIQLICKRKRWLYLYISLQVTYVNGGYILTQLIRSLQVHFIASDTTIQLIRKQLVVIFVHFIASDTIQLIRKRWVVIFVHFIASDTIQLI